MLKNSISDDEFNLFRDYFYRKTGIHFDNSKRYFVDKRLQERIESTSSRSFRSYFSLLRMSPDDGELQEVTNSMTINETYFLREEYQFRCMVQSLLPEIVRTKQSGSRIRIWCVPSSSGEEPYTLAMFLLECWPGIHQWDVELISSDIDTAILERARHGRYSARSVQLLPAPWLKKYFIRHTNEFQLVDEIREAVEFTRVNLIKESDTKHYRDFDIIFCRNLLIYFDDISRKQAVSALHSALRPGGFICLGHSESMNRISEHFIARKFPEAIVYQRARELM